MSKNKQQIKFEADVGRFKTNIKEAEKSITSLNNELKLNQSQLKGNENNTNLLSQRIETLKSKYEEQSKVVDNTRKSYERAVEIFGENSKEADNLKNKLLQAETAQQNIKNEIDKTNKQLETQTNKLITNSKKWQESGEKLKDYGSKIESVGNKLSVVSGLVGGIAVASLKASIDFESAFTGVTKTVDGTSEQLAQLRQGILDMSTELPSSATEISAVAESAGQLGIQTDNILDFTRVMIDLGNSTNVSAAEASSALAKFANVTKMSADDYKRLGSTIVALGNNYATTEADIIDMGQNLASAGTQVGMSQSDIMALATSLSSVGLEAQAGGTAFSKALVEMQLAVETNSKDLKNWASVAGMSTKNFAKLFKEDATGALQAFIKGLSECGGESKSAIKILDDMGITETRMRDALLRSANASDTFTNAIELGSKSWKENTALTDEAGKRYETTESQMKMLKNEAVKVASEFGDELAPSLRQIVKDAKPVLTNIASVVKAFAELDDKTKQNIIRMGALTVAMGPAIKIGGNLIKTVGSVKTGIGTLTGTIGVLRGRTEGASTSSQNLAGVIKSCFSPTGIATLAVVAGVGLIIKHYDDATEASRKHLEETKKATEKIIEEKKAIDDLRDSIDNNVQTDLNHIDRAAQLWQELQKITDENGKVEEGYQNRAKVITGDLSEALETEISMTGDVIDGYKDLQKEMDNLILKKKGESILKGSEEKYNMAIENVNQKTQELLDKEVELANAKKEEAKARQDYTNAILDVDSNPILNFEAEENWENKQADVESLTEGIKELNEEIEDGTKDIEDYEYKYKLFCEGTPEALQKMVDENITFYKKDEENVELNYLRKIKAQQKHLDDAKKRNEEAVKNNNTTEQSKSRTTINESDRRIRTLITELASNTKLVGENSADIISSWKELATNSYDIYSEEVSKLPVTTRQKIQEIIEGVSSNIPTFRTIMQALAQNGVDSLDKSSEFKAKAIESLNAYLEGMSDDQKRLLLRQAGINNVDIVMQELEKGDISEEKGTQILKGLYNGLGSSQFQKDLFNRASGISGRLTDLFTIKSTVSTVTTKNGTPSVMNKNLPGHKDGLDYVPCDNYVARLHKGERVLTSEENKQYMEDNIENKITSRNITVQFFPQSMTESEIQRAEKYIAKKWGMAL